MNIVPSQTA